MHSSHKFFIGLLCWPHTNSYRLRVGFEIPKEKVFLYFMTSDPSVRALALARQIADLSRELELLLSSPSPGRPVSPPPSPPPSGPIQVGEVVFITNRYGSHYGSRACVIGEVGKGSFELRKLSTGETFQKRRRNVSRSL